MIIYIAMKTLLAERQRDCQMFYPHQNSMVVMVTIERKNKNKKQVVIILKYSISWFLEVEL